MDWKMECILLVLLAGLRTDEPLATVIEVGLD